MNTEAAKNFIINHARPLEMALYRYFYEIRYNKLRKFESQKKWEWTWPRPIGKIVSLTNKQPRRPSHVRRHYTT